MRWFNWVGVALQVVGLLGAMYLLGRLREAVTGREVAPLSWGRAAWRRLAAAWRRLRRTPKPAVYGYAHMAQADGVAAAHGVTTRGPMPDGLALPDQVAWVSDYVRGVERKVNDLSSEVWRQASAQDDAVKATRDYAEKRIREAVDDVRSEVRQLVGQDVGWEIFWLAVVAVGVVMAAL